MGTTLLGYEWRDPHGYLGEDTLKVMREDAKQNPDFRGAIVKRNGRTVYWGINSTPVEGPI